MSGSLHQQRTPSPSPMHRLFPFAFHAAGKPYPAPFALRCLKTLRPHEYRDCYGRRVLYLRERFPCFDSGDYRYENRFYRYYLILHGGRLTLVQTRDEYDEVTVNEQIDRQWLLQRLGRTGRDFVAHLDKAACR